MLWLWLLSCAMPAPEPPEAPAGHAVGALHFSSGPPRNLLLITLDTTRKRALGRYGGGGNSPFLDRLLEEGVALDRHRSCSAWTPPSMLCVLSGRSALDVGAIPQANDPQLPSMPEVHTLADMLGEAGFTTSLVSTNSFVSSSESYGEGYQRELLMPGGSAEEATAGALEEAVALAADDPPWLLHLHLYDPHTPYAPPSEYLGRLYSLPPLDVDVTESGALLELRSRWAGESPEWQALAVEHLEAAHAAELRYADDQLADWFEAMDALGALDDTLVVLATDHGEQFFERGQLGHPHDLQVEEVEAMAAFWAQDLHAVAIDSSTTHIDLLPTMLGALDVPVESDLDGLIVGHAPPDRVRHAMLYLDYLPMGLAVISERRQLLYDFDGSRSFHRLQEDPLALEDDYHPEDPAVQALWRPMRQRVERVLRTWPDRFEPTHAWP